MKNAILFFFLLCSISSFAQTDPEKAIDEFFKIYKSKGVDASMDFLFKSNKWMSNQKDQIESVKSKLEGTMKLVGDYYGYDFVTKKTVGDHLALYTYMVRYDRQPIRFSLTFYKANDQWMFFNFKYDDNMDDELEEAIKVSMLKENLEY